MRPLALLVLVLAAGSALAGDVIRVPRDVPSIQQAVVAAAPGDVVVVDAAAYAQGHTSGPEWISITGKGISLIAVDGLVLLSRLMITGVPAGERVVVRGFRIGPLSHDGWLGQQDQSTAATGLTIEHNTGSVRIEDCVVLGFQGHGGGLWVDPNCGVDDCPCSEPPALDSGAGARVVDSASVVLLRCELVGAAGDDVTEPCTDPYAGGHGLALGSSTLAAYDTLFQGGAFPGSWGGSAGHGVDVGGGARLHLSGCQAVGGDGGGHGLWQGAADAETTTRDSVFGGGGSGQPVDVTAGGFVEYPAAHRGFWAQSPGWEAHDLALQFELEPADQALLVASLDDAFVDAPGLQGVLHVGAPLSSVALPLPAGDVELLVRLPQLPPMTQALDAQLQLVVQSPGGDLLLGPVTGTALLATTVPPIDIDCPPSLVLTCVDPTDPEHTGAATGSSVCGDVTITWADEVTSSECALTTLERTWTVADTCGRTTSCVQTLTVVDPPPTLVCPPDVTVAYTDPTTPGETGTATGDDLCGPVTVTFADSTAPGVCALEATITRTWTVTDACGQAASAEQRIHVVDTVAPALVVPPDVVVPCGASLDPADTGLASGSDDAGEVTILYADAFDPDCLQAGSGVITRTWIAEDSCGNWTSLDQVITIEGESLSISCPPDVMLPCGEPKPPKANNLWQFLAQGGSVDAGCGVQPTLFWLGDTTTGSGCAKVVTRTYRAVDGCGNTAQCQQIISWAETP